MIPFFAFPPEVRRVIYTTNAIESVNARLRKIIKTRGHFPSDDAATKLIWLALRRLGTGGEPLEIGHEPVRHTVRRQFHSAQPWGCKMTGLNPAKQGSTEGASGGLAGAL